MTVHSSGTTLKFSEIAQEFGFSPNKNLGAYRVNQTVGDRNWTLDSGVPSSGTIKFSDLYEKTLNVVVDYPPDYEVTSLSPNSSNFTRSLSVPSGGANSYWSQFLKSYAVWIEPGNMVLDSPQGSSWTINLPTTANYIIQLQADNYAFMDIDGNRILENSNFSEGNLSQTVISLSQGSHTVFCQAINNTSPDTVNSWDNNPAGVAWRISTGLEYEPNVNATIKYQNGTVIGGFKSLPYIGNQSQTKKVYHLIRKKIGASVSDSTAFVSGDWNNTSTVSLNFIVSGTGAIYGKGGNGGDGANIDESAPSANTSFYSGRTNSVRYGAQSGGHALSILYNSTVIVEPGGALIGGAGGGGGGGYKYNGGPDARGAGYGGGGGAGYPAGSGGAGGYVNERGRNGNVCQGGPGADGSLTIGGIGGPQIGGSRTDPCGLTGGDNGGFGGFGGNSGTSGSAGENKNTPGGDGAPSGNSIYHPGITVNLINSGTVLGPY